MVAGRPRTTSFSPEEMIELGEEMIEWVLEHNPLHLSAWYSIHKCFTNKQWDAFQQVPEFLPYYERALHIVGQNYIDKSSNVRDGISQRWQRVYFKDLKRQEDQDLDDAAKRASKENATDADLNKELLMALMRQINGSQQSSAKIADSNNNSDAKS